MYNGDYIFRFRDKPPSQGVGGSTYFTVTVRGSLGFETCVGLPDTVPVTAADIEYVHWSGSATHDLRDFVDGSANAAPSECALEIHKVHLYTLSAASPQPDLAPFYEDLMGDKYSSYPLEW